VEHLNHEDQVRLGLAVIRPLANDSDAGAATGFLVGVDPVDVYLSLAMAGRVLVRYVAAAKECTTDEVLDDILARLLAEEASNG
jgi:hypothetical protein